jgi:hypothetical protein
MQASPSDQEAAIAAYREVVASNYANSTGQELGQDEWPEGQAKIVPTYPEEDDGPVFVPITCSLIGAPKHYILGCDPSNAATTPYGLPPSIPCGQDIVSSGR